MSNYQNDLMFTTLESQSELYFTSRCNEMLKYRSKDMILRSSESSVIFNSMFTNSILSAQNVHFIMLKKYYLSTPLDRPISRQIHNLIINHRFKDLEALISHYPLIRRELLEIYLNNMNTPNYQLALIKLETTNYDDINHTLNEMNHFYTEQIYGTNPTLKKNYDV